VIKSSILF